MQTVADRVMNKFEDNDKLQSSHVNHEAVQQ